MNIREVSGILTDHEKRLKSLEKLFENCPESATKPISIKEFLLEKKPSNDVERTLVLACYLEKFRGNRFFNAKEIQEAFREAKESVPSNVNDKINLNISRGYVALHTEKKEKMKAWYITNTGEAVVETGFNSA